MPGQTFADYSKMGKGFAMSYACVASLPLQYIKQASIMVAVKSRLFALHAIEPLFKPRKS